MAQAMPLWLLGKHLTAVTITPLTEDATTGAVSEGTAQTLTGQIDFVLLAMDPVTDTIMPVNATRVHTEILMNSDGLVLGEILTRKNGSTEPILPALVYAYDLMKVIFTRGGKTWTYYGRRGPYSDGVSSPGKNIVELTLLPINPSGTPNPLVLS